ncbi:hypothetical protein NYE67_20565 [Solibacillus sp. FSL W8-0474]|uniref:hypothetical protein n=1 Tax=Solibacillus sp. FSL W8-0474 TaxID=2975336 RepID=UPI0030F5F1DB
MKILYAWKVITAHSKDEFDMAVLDFVVEQQDAGYEVTTQFTPIMQPNGKPLYMAYLEARQ